MKNASSIGEVKDSLLLGVEIMTGVGSGIKSVYSAVGTLADILELMGKNVPESFSLILAGMETPYQIWLDFNNPLVSNADIVLNIGELIFDLYGSVMVSYAASTIATTAATVVNPVLGAVVGVAVLFAGDAMWEEFKSYGA